MIRRRRSFSTLWLAPPASDSPRDIEDPFAVPREDEQGLHSALWGYIEDTDVGVLASRGDHVGIARRPVAAKQRGGVVVSSLYGTPVVECHEPADNPLGSKDVMRRREIMRVAYQEKGRTRSCSARTHMAVNCGGQRGASLE